MKKIISILIVLVAFGYIQAQPERESSDFSYALKLFNQKFYDLSIQQFEKFYNLYPNSSRAADAHYYAGMAYFHLNKYNEAQREFQTLALGYPKSARAAEAWFKSGQSAEKAGDFTVAVKAYESIRLLYPESTFAARGMFAAGMVYLHLNQFAKAEVVFGQLLERYPDSPFYFPALAKRAACFYFLNQYEKAQTAVKKVLSGQPDDEARLEAQLISGRLAAALGKFDQARNTLQAVLAESKGTPVFDQALLELSALLIQNGNYQQASKLITRHIASVKDSLSRAQAKERLGDLYFVQDQYGMAEKEYRDLLKIHTADSLQLLYGFKLALSLKHQKLMDQALTSLEQAINASPAENGFLAVFARQKYLDWLDETDRDEQAITFLYRELESISGIKSDARTGLTLRLAQFLEKNERWPEVIHLLKPLVQRQEVYPGKDEVVFLLARAYEEVKDYAECMRLYRQITTEYAASPFYSEAQRRMNNLTALKIINKDRALAHQAELIGHLLDNKDRALLKFQLAKIYFEDLKNFERAEKQLKSAMADSSHFQGDLHLFLGKLYFTLSSQSNLTEAEMKRYLELAQEQFKNALKDSASCTALDEASWLLVKTTLTLGDVSAAQEKRLIETLLVKFPDSPLQEAWLHTLALDLAFDSSFVDISKNYFKSLIEDFNQSPHISSYLYDYGKLLKNDSYEQAVVYFKKIALEHPYAPQTFHALEEVAEYYRMQEDYSAAYQIYSRMLQSYGYLNTLEQVRQQLAMISIRTGAYKQALHQLKQELPAALMNDLVLSYEFLPENYGEKIYFLARAFEGNGNIRMATVNYLRYLRLNADGRYAADAHFRLGELYFRAHQKDIALEHFKLVPASNPELYLPARNFIAKIYFENKDYAAAAAEYKSLSSYVEDPDQQAAVEQKYIISLIRNGQLKESSGAIKQFKKKFPDHKNALAAFAVEIGEYHRMKKNFKQAIKSFEQVKKKYKSTEYVDDADYYLALTNITLNKVEDAYKILSKFYTNYPNSDLLPAALNTLGNLYFRGEKYDNAIAMFKNALQYCADCPMKASIMSNLIKTYTFTGFWDAAQALARQYVQEFPDAEDRIDKKIIIARAYINLNQFDNAVNYLKKIKLEADAEREPEIQFYIGEALMKAGDYENSIAEFVKIPLLSKKTKLQWEASALYYAGQCYEKLGRASDAVRMYQEIVNRPGIDLVLKKEAKKRINQISGKQ